MFIKMISIIICSRNTQIDSDLYSNLQETIGLDYELIVIDNSKNVYSIYEAYNLGIKKSTGDYLCFIHDDIRFHTKNWGKIIESIFQSDENIGLIGVAGTKIKAKITSAWWDCPEKYRVMNIKQQLKSGQVEDWFFGWNNSNIEEVVAIDGVFMAMPRKDKIYFTNQLKGFHNYDLDISFKVKKNKKKIVVTNQLLLEHFSEGKVDASWVKSTLKIHNLYNDILPLNVVDNFSLFEYKDIDFENVKKMIYLSFIENRKYLALRIWITFFLEYPRNKYHSLFWKEFLNLK